MHSAHRTSARTPDFDQHADRRAISQDMEKQNKGPCTPSLTSSYAFFVFVIFSSQNACYRCENTEIEPGPHCFYCFMSDEGFGGSV